MEMKLLYWLGLMTAIAVGVFLATILAEHIHF